MAWVSWRETELAPVMAESTCSSFMMVSLQKGTAGWNEGIDGLYSADVANN
jgi:hypothetical protein